jgi:hypothetical protein
MEVMWSLCGDGYQPRTAYIPDPGRSVSPSQVRPDMALFNLLPATLDGTVTAEVTGFPSLITSMGRDTLRKSANFLERCGGRRDFERLSALERTISGKEYCHALGAQR